MLSVCGSERKRGWTRKPELRIASSQTEKPAKTCRVRWSRLVLAAVGCVACVGVALSARRVLSQPHSEARAAQVSSPVAVTDAVSDARERLEQFEASRR